MLIYITRNQCPRGRDDRNTAEHQEITDVGLHFSLVLGHKLCGSDGLCKARHGFVYIYVE